MTIGQLGRRAGLSRSTLLYYDRLGLLKASGRSGARYRLYTHADLERLTQICFYRTMGIPLEEIGRLVSGSQGGPTQAILRRRLDVLGQQIRDLQKQQRDIIRLLEQLTSRKGHNPLPGQQPHTKENTVMKKERWVQIMEAAGFTAADRQKWHQTFEQMEPEEHQVFLESLGIASDEALKLREHFRK